MEAFDIGCGNAEDEEWTRTEIPFDGERAPMSAYYPLDRAGRQQLADELKARGLKPTQTKENFDRGKIDKIADAMQDGSFDWNRASLQPIIVGPNGEILNGHHRVIAAHLTGIDLTAIPGPRPQVQRLPRTFRPEHLWIDVLPDVP